MDNHKLKTSNKNTILIISLYFLSLTLKTNIFLRWQVHTLCAEWSSRPSACDGAGLSRGGKRIYHEYGTLWEDYHLAARGFPRPPRLRMGRPPCIPRLP